MPQSIALRAAGLAAVTLVAAVIALALTRGDGDSDAKAPKGTGTWYRALAAPYVAAKPKRGACGVMIARRTMGVANPVLPCGVKVEIEFGGKHVVTQVIDRGPSVPGRDFDITRALARELGLTGTKTINWRFAK
jgi:rare lipoprotein A (peptidoglycan hydrolase)